MFQTTNLPVYKNIYTYLHICIYTVYFCFVRVTKTQLQYQSWTCVSEIKVMHQNIHKSTVSAMTQCF